MAGQREISAGDFAEDDGNLLDLARPQHPERVGRFDVEGAQDGEERVQAPKQWIAVDRHQRVPLKEPGLMSGAIWLDRDDQEPAFLSEVACQGLGQPDGLDANPKIGAADATMGSLAFGDALGGLHRERAAEAAAEVPAVVANDPTIRIDEWPAKESRQQLGRRLDQ